MCSLLNLTTVEVSLKKWGKYQDNSTYLRMDLLFEKFEFLKIVGKS